MAIERKFIKQNLKEFRIKEHVQRSLNRVGLAGVKLRKTPLGDRIVLYASRPGLVVGRAGQNIARLTKELKDVFQLENPQIEIEEVEVPDMDPNIIAERIINSLERFGSNRFKGIGHRAMADVMNTGNAFGVEIRIGGKVPSTRAKSWRFYMGYLKKCGDIATEGVLVSKKAAILKTGALGVQVQILPNSVILPDHVKVLKDMVVEVESKNLAPSELHELTVQATEESSEVTAETTNSDEKKIAKSAKKTIKTTAKKTAVTQTAKKKVTKKSEITEK